SALYPSTGVSEIGIIGAGYVGVPLAETFAKAGHNVLLVEVQQGRVDQLNRGESYVEDVPSETLKELVDAGKARATTDYDEPRGGAVRVGDRHRPPAFLAGGGGTDEAAREHLPLGQHRPGQRARPALRPDGPRRLGDRRRGRDEAVRVHALRARAGARRALP